MWIDRLTLTACQPELVRKTGRWSPLDGVGLVPKVPIRELRINGVYMGIYQKYGRESTSHLIREVFWIRQPVMNTNRIKTVIELLEKVVGGQIDANSAMEKWPDIDAEEDDLIKAGWHELSHLANDTDIRAKDKEYEEILKDNLREFVREIREKFFKA